MLLGLTRWWLGGNELPDGYQNEFIHLFTLGEIVFRLRDDGLLDALPFLRDQYWPPLLHLVPGLAMAIWEPSRELVTFASALTIVPLLATVAALASRAGGPWAAALATTLTASAPAVFGNVRRYEPNMLLLTLILGACWFLTTRARRSDRAFMLGVGVLFGLGLLADRLAFAVYLAPVVLTLLVRERAWRRWLGAAVVCGGVSGWYYVRFAALHLQEITSQLGGEVTADGDVVAWGLWSLRGLLYYPLSWADGGAGLLPTLLILAGLGLWVWGRRVADAPVASVLVPLLVGGLVIFTLVAKKQPYYGIPLLVAAIVLASTGWTRVLSGRRRGVLLVAVLLLGAHQLLLLTVARGLVPAPGRWAVLGGESPFPDGFLGNEYVQAAPPAPAGVRPADIAAICAQTGGPAVLFSEGQGAYEGQLMPTLRLALDTRRVPGLLMEPEAWTESVQDATCFVYVAGADEGPRGPRAVDRSWPTRDSMTPILEQWNQVPPTPAMLEELREARSRARLRERWTTERQETVYIYALARRGGADLH